MLLVTSASTPTILKFIHIDQDTLVTTLFLMHVDVGTGIVVEGIREYLHHTLHFTWVYTLAIRAKGNKDGC